MGICGVAVQWLVTGAALMALFSSALLKKKEEGSEWKDGMEEERKKEKNAPWASACGSVEPCLMS